MPFYAWQLLAFRFLINLFGSCLLQNDCQISGTVEDRIGRLSRYGPGKFPFVKISRTIQHGEFRDEVGRHLIAACIIFYSVHSIFDTCFLSLSCSFCIRIWPSTLPRRASRFPSTTDQRTRWMTLLHERKRRVICPCRVLRMRRHL